MSYRDERESLRLRVEQLEGELSDAKQDAARLRGERAEALAEGERSWFTGHSPRTHMERELELEVSDAGYEAIAELLRARLPNGQASQVGRTLTYRWGEFEVRMSRTEMGGTRLRVSGVHGGGGVLAAGSAGLSIISASMLAGLAEAIGAGSIGMAIAVPVAMLATFLGLRALVARGVHKHRADLQGAVEAMADLAAKHAVDRRVRIATKPAEAELQAIAETEAAAETEALDALEQEANQP